MKHDLLSDALSIINNAEHVGKDECLIPVSNFIKNVLEVIKESSYVEEIIYDSDKKKFAVKLAGKINKIKIIKPRFSVKKDEYDKWERRYLPSRSIGILVVSTSKGIMNQKQAVKQGLGGKLVAYAY